MQKYPNFDKNTKNPADSDNVNNIKFSYPFEISPIYETSEIIIHGLFHENNVFHLYASSSKDYGICPYCGQVSNRVHSKYFRNIKDLPILGEQVILHFESRKFFCHNTSCSKKTFAEQPGTEIFRYRRRTCRCERIIARHGISVSSNSASRLLSYMGINISASTILRDLHRMKPASYEDVTAIGVDDWAWRKGVTYGSIIIDYTNEWPIDLLGDREAENFHQWIESHSKVNIVSRDRSTDYSAAIASTKRQITEIADKFHLIKNITDRMNKLVAENYADYREAIRTMEEAENVELEEPSCTSMIKECPKKKVDLRDTMFQEVKELQQKGFKPFRIARQLGIARQTATKYCQMDSLPDRNSKLRNEYYKYDAHVEREAASGKALCVIHKEICKMGFSGSLTPFYEHYKYLSDGHRGFRSKSWKPDTKRKKNKDNRSELLPIKSIAAVINKIVKGHNVNETQQKTFDVLMSLSWFKEMYEAMKTFYNVIKGNETVALIRWMKSYWSTNIPSLRTFIIGIKKDFHAVRNTIKYNITNGITEGFVNKLKAVKRSMYGRAGLDLLKNKLVLEHVLFN